MLHNWLISLLTLIGFVFNSAIIATLSLSSKTRKFCLYFCLIAFFFMVQNLSGFIDLDPEPQPIRTLSQCLISLSGLPLYWVTFGDFGCHASLLMISFDRFLAIKHGAYFNNVWAPRVRLPTFTAFFFVYFVMTSFVMLSRGILYPQSPAPACDAIFYGYPALIMASCNVIVYSTAFLLNLSTFLECRKCLKYLNDEERADFVRNLMHRLKAIAGVSFFMVLLVSFPSAYMIALTLCPSLYSDLLVQMTYYLLILSTIAAFPVYLVTWPVFRDVFVDFWWSSAEKAAQLCMAAKKKIAKTTTKKNKVGDSDGRNV